MALGTYRTTPSFASTMISLVTTFDGTKLTTPFLFLQTTAGLRVIEPQKFLHLRPP
jgi:hypothetical protein